MRGMIARLARAPTLVEFALRRRPLQRVPLVLALVTLGLAGSAAAFPPYRSTDADTAPPGTLETRVGLLRLEREDHENAYTTPLLRVNLGVAPRFEAITELEYDAEGARLAEGAVGLKWAEPFEPVALGVEALALLPVSSELSGVGVEAQLVATHRRGPLRLHANAGGFYDPRHDERERGWRASVLAEWERGPARFGAELFAKQPIGDGAELLAGPGVIWSLGGFDVRAALHAGLTEEAPDWVANLWLSTEWKLW
jgi:hypothetical protein